MAELRNSVEEVDLLNDRCSRPPGETSKLRRKKSQADSLSDSSLGGLEEGDDDSIEDSDPEEATTPALGADNDSGAPTIEEDRETLLKALGQPTWETFESFKAAHEERLKRCFMADPRDQNRTLFHWLALKLLQNSLSNNSYLQWLVELVLSYDAEIINQITADSQKANCLHIAVQQGRFDLIDCFCKVAQAAPLEEAVSQALRKAISQGNDSDETCLHLVIKLDPPRLKLLEQLLNKADSKVIAKRRSNNHSNDKSEDLNTVLHDFVHISRCFEKGYMKILKRLTQDCPEAMKVQNAANETPLQFHLRTRSEEHPRFGGLEFANQPFKVTGQGQAPSNDEWNQDEQKRAESAAKAGQHLLNGAFSQPSHEDACACIYGDKQFDRAISFQPASPINSRTEKSHLFLKFYPILSYVELTLVEHDPTELKHENEMHYAVPAEQLGNNTDSPHTAYKMRTNSVIGAFRWFRKQNVQRILKVVIVDDSAFPCSDETIEECLRGFDIRYLNWNKDDFCPAILHSAKLHNIRELWLSWSGRNSVLYSWSCKNTGLPTMKKLDIVHIETRTSTESGDRDTQNLKSFEFRLQDAILKTQIEDHRLRFTKKVTKTLESKFERFGELRITLQQQMLTSSDLRNDAKIAKINEGSPPPLAVTIGNLEGKIMDYLKEQGELRKIKVDDKTNHSWIDGKKPRHQMQVQHGHRWVDAARRLADAVSKERIQHQHMMRPIKICLIDDGVTPGELNSPNSLKDGWPLPSTRKRNASKPYYCSEKGHGTKMARLIQMMCPYVWIYVAKVDMHRNEDSSIATSAAEAVRWAIENQVDIICMSWTVKKIKNGPSQNKDAIDSLELAIKEAATHDIIMLCSVEDSAHYGVADVYPQKIDTKKLLMVGSADENGDRSKFVNENSFDYLFPGEVTIPGLLSLEDVGSSVATAIAAGMAAMILWCAEHHSAAIRASQNEGPGQAAAATLSTSLTIDGAPKMTPRTASQWDFREDMRMNSLFNALKPTNDKFVDVTAVINHALQHIDDIDEVTPEKQSTCTKRFITRCKEHLPIDLR